MHRFQILPILILVMVVCPNNIQGQAMPFVLDIHVPGINGYDKEIPRPESIIGHKIGKKHTHSHQVNAYYQAVAERSTRVVVKPHGATYEGRTLVHAVVTSPENHRRLEKIRQRNHRLSDTPGEVSNNMIESMPIVIQMGYGVHGNEASSSEAAMLVLYHLAAGIGPALNSLLDSAVIILDPNYNPDGRERFVNWVNSNRGRIATQDNQDREHVEPWPGGRTNHYLFDLNRDWLAAQQPESQGRLALFHHWRPQLLTDFHEMGSNSTYFFQPGIPSRNNPNTPVRNFELTAALAEYHADWHNRQGTLYYSKETFDDYFYGKGSTYPDINGAIGILFEQASARSLKRVTNDGILTFPFTIRNQFISSMSTLAGGLALRKELLLYQRDFYKSAVAAARRNTVKAYVLDLSSSRTRTQTLVQMLLRHRIRVFELDKVVETGDGRFLPGETVLIPMDQPQTRMIKTAMERVTSFEDSIFYDVSAWSLPLAMRVRTGKLHKYDDGLAGKEITKVVFDGGQVIGGQKMPYAYLMRWDRYFAPRALYRILNSGIRPRLARESFSLVIDGTEQTFERGTIIIPVAQRDAISRIANPKVRELIDLVVAEDHVVVHSVDTGLTQVGNDLGSPNSPVLVKPEVAILSGPGTRAYEVGETWHLLNERFGIPVSLIDTNRFSALNLEGYTTIVMVMGKYDLEINDVDRLKNWIRKGGTLIAWKSAARWLIEKNIIDEQLQDSPPDTTIVSYGLVSKTRGAQRIGGAIFAAVLDTTHPLAFGHREVIPLFRNHEIFFEPSSTPGATVARYSSTPLLSGYISSKRIAELSNTSALIARRLGKGAVVVFADNPNFRAFWYGTNGLFMNAIFFGSVF